MARQRSRVISFSSDTVGGVVDAEPWKAQLEALGNLIRSQRKLAQLSLRELAERTNVSNPYLSQIERGLHEPSVRVLRSIARALNVSAETLLAQAGLLDDEAQTGDTTSSSSPSTEAAIRADAGLTDPQKEALLGVYRSYVAANR
jgi:transcriptional regulator with XRE-family HTH domain